MTRRRALYLGVDVGTSVVKGAVVDENGSLVRTAARSWERLRAGAPQTTGGWWTAFVTLVRDLRRRSVNLDAIEGVAVSGTSPTVCLLNRAGRASKTAAMHTDGFEHLAAFVLDSDGTTVLTPSGFINYVLTGEVSMDSLSRYELASLRLESRAPRPVSVLTTIGRVRPSASKSTGLKTGTPVCAGTFDVVASLAGSGATVPRDAVLNYGTYGSWLDLRVPLVDMLSVANVTKAPYTWRASVPLLGRHMRGIAMRLSPSTDSGASLALLDRLAEQSAAGGNGVVFIPHDHLLTPSVFDNPRGAFAGITPRTRREDVARAALESFGFSLRLVARVTGQPFAERRLFAAGGGARSGPWVKMTSAIIGQPQWRRGAAADALGTALLAMLSQHQPSAAGANRLLRTCVPLERVPCGRRDRYRDAFRRFQDAYRMASSTAMEPMMDRASATDSRWARGFAVLEQH